MGWEQTAIGDKSYRQDTTMGCPFACISTVKYWIQKMERTEAELREKLTSEGIEWGKKEDAMTAGLNLDIARKLIKGVGLDYLELPDGISADEFQKKMREAHPNVPLILGVAWSTGEKHLVVCAGKSSDGKVWIFDPGAGLGEHPVGTTYESSGYKGTFDLKGIEVLCSS